MGKIPEYQRNRFASSYVGGAQRDDSGEVIMQAATQAIAPHFQQAIAELKQRQDQIADQAANKAVMQYGISFQEQAQALQNTHADNPKEYPSAIYNMGTELAEEYQKSIPDDRVRSKFLNATNVMQRQAMGTAVQWAFAKQQANVQVDIVDALETIAIAAGESTVPVELASNLQAITETLFDISDTAVDGIPHDVKVKMQAEYNDRALRAHLANRLGKEPFNLAADLTAGVYDNIRIETARGELRVPLTAELKRDFIEKSKAAEAKQDYRKLLDDIVRFDDAGRELATKWFDGTASVGDIQKEVNRANADPNATPEYRRYAEKILAASLSRRTQTAFDLPAVVIPIDVKVANLSQTLAKIKKLDRKHGVGRPKSQEHAVGILTDLLEIRADAWDAYSKGFMTREKLNGIEREIGQTITQGVLAQEGRGKGGWFGIGGYKDNYGAHYTSMNKKINGYAGISDEDKQVAKVDAAKYFIENVMALKAQNPLAPLTSTQYEQAEQSAMNLVSQTRNPNHTFYKVGDVVDGYKIVGFREDGRAEIDVPSGVRDAVLGRSN